MRPLHAAIAAAENSSDAAISTAAEFAGVVLPAAAEFAGVVLLVERELAESELEVRRKPVAARASLEFGFGHAIIDREHTVDHARIARVGRAVRATRLDERRVRVRHQPRS